MTDERKLLTCELCGGSPETPKTRLNPSAAMKPGTLVRCASCLYLFMVGEHGEAFDLRSIEGEQLATAATDADPELDAWVRQGLDVLRVQWAEETKADCAAARLLLLRRNGPDLKSDLATLDAYANSFDDRGIPRVSRAVRRRAVDILLAVTPPQRTQ